MHAPVHKAVGPSHKCARQYKKPTDPPHKCARQYKKPTDPPHKCAPQYHKPTDPPHNAHASTTSRPTLRTNAHASTTSRPTLRPNARASTQSCTTLRTITYVSENIRPTPRTIAFHVLNIRPSRIKDATGRPPAGTGCRQAEPVSMPFTHRTTVRRSAAQHLAREIRAPPVLFQHAEARADSNGTVRKSRQEWLRYGGTSLGSDSWRNRWNTPKNSPRRFACYATKGAR